jgi:hypothetical protein
MFSMKIRLQHGSVRFRLRQGDARVLVTQGRVEETVSLCDNMLVCCLELHEGRPSITLHGARLTARIPAAEARSWHSGDQVGLYYTPASGTRLVVEKDWACLEPAPGETNEDTFARPRADRAGCGAS